MGIKDIQLRLKQNKRSSANIGPRSELNPLLQDIGHMPKRNFFAGGTLSPVLGRKSQRERNHQLISAASTLSNYQGGTPKQLLLNSLKPQIIASNFTTKRNSFGFVPTAALGEEESVTVKLPEVETRKDIPILELREKFKSKSALKKYENPFSPKRSLVGKHPARSSMLAGEDRRTVALDKAKQLRDMKADLKSAITIAAKQISLTDKQKAAAEEEKIYQEVAEDEEDQKVDPPPPTVTTAERPTQPIVVASYHASELPLPKMSKHMLSVLQEINRIEEDREAEEDGPQESQLNSTEGLQQSPQISSPPESNPLYGYSYTHLVDEIKPPAKSPSRLSPKPKKSSKTPKIGKKEKEQRQKE